MSDDILDIIPQLQIEDNTNKFLLKKLSIAREHFWNFIFYMKDDFSEFEIKVLNTICDNCGCILKNEDSSCKNCKTSTFVDMGEVSKNCSPGKGRKPCPNCKNNIAARTIICKICSYDLKNKILTNIKPSQIVSKNKKRKKCISVKIKNINDVSILIENDKTLNNILIFKNIFKNPNLNKLFDESSKIAYRCVISSKEELVKNNINLVRSIAYKIFFSKKKKLRHLQLDDLIQEGNRGLLKAIDKFDTTKKYEEKDISFSTYATFWITREILKSVIVQDKYIRLPDHIVNKYKNFQNFYFDYVEHNNEPPTIDTLCKELKLSQKNIEALLFTINNNLDYINLDYNLFDDESNAKLLHLYKSGIYHNDKYENIDFIINIVDSIKFKNEDYKNAFLDMFTFFQKEYTLDELSVKYNISKVTLIKIREETLDKLRKKVEDIEDL